MIDRLLRLLALFTLMFAAVAAARASGAMMPGGTVLAYTTWIGAANFQLNNLVDTRINLHYRDFLNYGVVDFEGGLYVIARGWETEDTLHYAVSDSYLEDTVGHYWQYRLPGRITNLSSPTECQRDSLTATRQYYACTGIERGLWLFDVCFTGICHTPPRHLIPQSLVQTWLWSPDGTRIAYFDIAPFTTGLAVIDVATEQVQRVTDSLGAEVPLVSWSPDGMMLAYYVLDREGRTLQVYDLAAEAVTLRLPLDVLVSQQPPEWSPDGTMLAYTTSQTHQLYIASRITGAVEQLINRVAEMPKWSPDGRWIAYSTRIGQDAGIHLYHVETGASQPMALFDPLTGTLPGMPYAWRPCPESSC